MSISSPSDDVSEGVLEALTGEDRQIISDWLANPIYKGQHFGFFGNPENETDAQTFWDYLSANPFPTVQEKAAYIASTREGRPSLMYENFIKNCPHWVEKINGIIARLNAARNVVAYKRLINELILIACPDAIARGYDYHHDV